MFNFEYFRDESVRMEDVTLVDLQEIPKFEGNDVLRGIRDLKFRTELKDKIDTTVPTDPGSEVVYNGDLVQIVLTEGTQALIEDINGKRFIVSLDKLEIGRKTHTNSWNYREGESFNSAEADGSARVFAGQYVWIPARKR